MTSATRRSPRQPLVVSWGMALAVLGACATPDPARLDDGRAIRDLPPAALRLGIGPLDGQPIATAEPDAIPHDWTRDAIERGLLDGLRELRAATELVPVADAADAAAQGCDLYLQPRLERPQIDLRYADYGSNWFASLGFWMVTWVGGLFFEDSLYATDLQLGLAFLDRQSIVDGHDLATRSWAGTTLTSGDVELAFFDRNPFFSWPTVQSFVLPPFWTSDSEPETGAILAERALFSVAAQAARYLKLDLERALELEVGTIAFGASAESPLDNESLVPADGRIPLVVRASSSVDRVEVAVDDRPLGADLEPIDIERQQTGAARFIAPFLGERALQLDPAALPADATVIRVVAVLADGNRLHRTLRLFRSEAARSSWLARSAPAD
ncbi:MAG: hypothetical protein IPM29_16355 [Planctomycetes bacterium]|nr:hypothetical protein [Planctomycetota bacterium]